MPRGYLQSGRTLVENPDEAPLIRKIYAGYLLAGSIGRLKALLDADGETTRRTMSPGGVAGGGKPFVKNHLHAILSNPLYNGKIVHKGTVYEGQHPGLIEDDTWRAVQDMLQVAAAHPRGRARHSTRAGHLRTAGHLTITAGSDTDSDTSLIHTAPLTIRKRGVETKVIIGAATARPDPVLIDNLARAHLWYDALKSGETFKAIAAKYQTDVKRLRQTLQLAFLAPDITASILSGQQPVGLTSKWIQMNQLPHDRDAQRELLAAL